LFRYGVAVLIGLTPREEDEVLRELRPRVIRPLEITEEKIASVEVDAAKNDQIMPGGPIVLKTLTPEHLIVIAAALARSVARARDRPGGAVRAPARREGRHQRPARHPAAHRQRAPGAAPRIRPCRRRRQARPRVGSPRPRAPDRASAGRIRAQGTRRGAVAQA